MSDQVQANVAEVKASVFFNRVADVLSGGMFASKYFGEVTVIINTLRQIAAKDAEREAAAAAPVNAEPAATESPVVVSDTPAS